MALSLVAALWLVPFKPDNRAYYTRSCVPIREALRHRPEGFPMDADQCHDRAVQRVEVGAVGGAALAILGGAVVVALWQQRRDPRAEQ